MPVGTKRAAEDSAEGTSKRVTKSAKTEKSSTPKNGKPTKAKVPTATEFKTKALPLHIIISHTPPSIQPASTAPHDSPVNTLSAGQSESEAVLPLGASPSSPSESSDSEMSITTTTAIGGDSGRIGSITLVPSTFSTGSFGWKGSSRIVVELLGGDNEEGGEREKVQVMLSINATVLGSKPSKAKKGEDTKEDSSEMPADEVIESQGEEADISSEAV